MSAADAAAGSPHDTSGRRPARGEHGAPPTGLARVLPILTWAPRYRRAWLRGDLLAGLAVAALVVPKSV